jgi:hypothetical protein
LDVGWHEAALVMMPYVEDCGAAVGSDIRKSKALLIRNKDLRDVGAVPGSGR